MVAENKGISVKTASVCVSVLGSGPDMNKTCWISLGDILFCLVAFVSTGSNMKAFMDPRLTSTATVAFVTTFLKLIPSTQNSMYGNPETISRQSCKSGIGVLGTSDFQ